MLFTELVFFVFLAAVFTLYWLLPRETGRKNLLLIASYVFYGAWDYRFLSLILLSTLVDYIAGSKIYASDDDGVRKRWLTLSLVTNLGLLGIFKYLNFFTASFIEFAQLVGLPADPVTLNIVLPVGISFYTFQTLSYSIDIYRKNLKPTDSPRDFALFVAFFPQLVAGPIVRARAFLPQLKQNKLLGTIDFRWAVCLFLIGFIKKACVADSLAPFVDDFYAGTGAYDFLTAWTAALAYTVQIYCDFSGYTDMAIATAALFGYKLCDNFNRPYLASSIKDFWRRWHISLSTWLRDYLYISLGGNRKSPMRTRANLIITMLLGGLWHGASWNFVAWGGLHGLGLMAYNVWEESLGRKWRMPTVVAQLLTFLFVVLLWVPFRAPDFATTWQVWNALFGFGSVVADDSYLASMAPRLLLLMAGLLTLHYAASKQVFYPLWRHTPGWLFALGYGAAWSLALAARSVGYTPFIYFQF